MKAIMVMYDSLNLAYLPNYGNTYVKMPNFERLGKKCATFCNSYAGSLPCMPARRELHTGRYNFLHRDWSPLEPFDDSMPEILKQHGIYTHLVSDHYHYWEDGGSTYHSRYSTWDCTRGQEGDPWTADLDLLDGGSYIDDNTKVYPPLANKRRQDWSNRQYIKEHNEYPQQITFKKGLDFIEKNKEQDQWFLQLETFDPHEPFFVPERFLKLYEENPQYDYDWPPYGICKESKEIVESVRRRYCALLSMCDECLGKVLDIMDANDMWKDTMLIVNTDHGYLLGERDWWGKGAMPVYNEIAHTPLFIWDPRSGICDERRESLVQTIDIAPTLLDYFGVEIPKDMQGIPLKDTIADDRKIREYALFGFYGAHVNVTDGEYIYMRGPADLSNSPLYNYTLMPLNMSSRMTPDKLRHAKLHEPFRFTKSCPVLQMETNDFWNTVSPRFHFGHMLFHLSEDPQQLNPIRNEDKEIELMQAIVKLMKENDAPAEQFERLGLPAEGGGFKAVLEKDARTEADVLKVPEGSYHWNKSLKWQYWTLCQIAKPFMSREEIDKIFIQEAQSPEVTAEVLLKVLKKAVPDEKYKMAVFTMDTMAHV